MHKEQSGYTQTGRKDKGLLEASSHPSPRGVKQQSDLQTYS